MRMYFSAKQTRKTKHPSPKSYLDQHLHVAPGTTNESVCQAIARRFIFGTNRQILAPFLGPSMAINIETTPGDASIQQFPAPFSLGQVYHPLCPIHRSRYTLSSNRCYTHPRNFFHYIHLVYLGETLSRTESD